jgi:hypothetical protein
MNDILLQVLADDKKLIIYRKELNKLTGSITATILLQQLIFHSSNKKYKPFYKFIEPCNNELYRIGDSWTEELGFTKNEFNTAYKKLEKLGVVTKKINMNRVTFYQLNRPVLGKAIMSIYEEVIIIPKPLLNNDSNGIPFVNPQCGLAKSDNVDFDYSKIKEQRIQEDEEERSEILNLQYLDDFIDETTNDKKSIKGNYISYRASVIEVLMSPKHKRHLKTKLNYQNYIKIQQEKIQREEIKPTKLEQLNDIVEINMDDFKEKKFNGIFDVGIIKLIGQKGIDSYEITYKGLGIRQSQPLLHVQLLSGKELRDNKL